MQRFNKKVVWTQTSIEQLLGCNKCCHGAANSPVNDAAVDFNGTESFVLSWITCQKGDTECHSTAKNNEIDNRTEKINAILLNHLWSMYIDICFTWIR